jgi:predicted PurR-regulated permease PerM
MDTMYLESRESFEGRWSAGFPGLMFFAGTVLFVAVLYCAQAILIPLALAVLLTFLLSPVVSALQRWGFSRSLAVTVVVLLTLLFLSGVAWFAAAQVRNLADELPQYRANIRQKVRDLRKLQSGGVLGKLSDMVGEVQSELGTSGKRGTQRPPPVPAPDRPFILETIAQPLASAGLVLLLLIYMLAQREELRNRLIRLLGYGNLSITTHALEEVGERISRYLVTQLSINSSFGLLVAIALALIDLPYAFLWGFLSTLLIFVPVIGFWLAAALPTILSLAVFTSWLWPLAVLGLFMVLKMTSNVVLEPLLYGKSAGVLQVPLLILLAFWTWLWGPIGLILATPLTVCLLVFAKYVPQLGFLNVLISDRPAMEAPIHFFQRLLALDYDEAEEIVETYRHEHQASAAEVYDALLLPTLSYAKADRRRGHLGDRQEKFIFSSIGALQEELAGNTPTASSSAPELQRMTVLGIAAEGDIDERALLLLNDLLDPQRFSFDIVAAEREAPAKLRESMTRVVIIGALPPGGVAQTRHLCKRLRTTISDLTVIVLRGATADAASAQRESFIASGADAVVYSLAEALARLEEIAHRSGGTHKLDPSPIGYVATAPESALEKNAQTESEVS